MLFRSIVNSNYNGMVLTGKYRGRHGIFIQGSYTLGKSLDYNSAFFGSTGEPGTAADNTNLRLEHGPSSFDVRHRAGFVYVVEIPMGPGHRLLGWNNGLNRQVFGGWQISGITTLQTGTPYTVRIGGADSSGFNQNNDRPDIVGTGRLQTDYRNPDAAFDKTYFKAALEIGRASCRERV